ncbi:MAG: nucleotide exchange factor GrpE [Methylococcales bacterium]
MSREQDKQEHEELLEALDEAEAKIDQLAGENEQEETADEKFDDEQETQQPEDDERLIIQELEQQLEQATAKAGESHDQFLRAKAELENLRRRTDRELENAHKYAVEKFAKELLTVIDSLELGIQAAVGIQAADNEDPEVVKLREGSELTLKLFADLMDKFNIKAIGEVGEPFDPEFHQAMATQPSQETEPDTVVQVMQKGYQMHDRLLRPALVIVSKAE